MHIIRCIKILVVCFFFLPGLVSGLDMNNEASYDLLNKAVTLFEKGNYDQSKKIVDQYLSENSENASALNLRGLILMNTDGYEDAKADFLNALKYSDKKSMLYYNLGFNSFNHGIMDEADEYFSFARSDNYSSFDLLFYSGLVKYALGSYDEAIVLFQDALVKNPDDSATWFNLGMSYEMVRKFDLAVKAYDNAISIDPGYEKPWFFKGRIYQSFGNESLSRLAFENYTSLAPKDDLGWFFYAKSLYADENINESILALKKAIEINPSEDMYMEYLNVYEAGNVSVRNELLFEQLPENVTILLFFVIFILGVFAIIRK